MEIVGVYSDHGRRGLNIPGRGMPHAVVLVDCLHSPCEIEFVRQSQQHCAKLASALIYDKDVLEHNGSVHPRRDLLTGADKGRWWSISDELQVFWGANNKHAVGRQW